MIKKTDCKSSFIYSIILCTVFMCFVTIVLSGCKHNTDNSESDYSHKKTVCVHDKEVCLHSESDHSHSKTVRNNPDTYSAENANSISPLDYNGSKNWIMADAVENSVYDVIYFYGTAVQEPTHANGVGDVSDEMKSGALLNYSKAGKQLSECAPTDPGISNYGKKAGKQLSECAPTDPGISNYGKKASVFIPAYRQIALSYATEKFDDHEDMLKAIAAKEPAADLTAALDYYFKHYNRRAHKPFILAGHSQGAAALQVILEQYFIKGHHKKYLKNMIAAYSIGYGVSARWFNDLNKSFHGKNVLHFVKGSADFNCLISWNTEGPGKKGKNKLLASEGDRTLVINPLNWKRDETYAGIELNKGVAIKNDALGNSSKTTATSATVKNNASGNSPKTNAPSAAVKNDAPGNSPKTNATSAAVKNDALVTSKNSNSVNSGLIISHKKSDLFDAQIDLDRGSIICTTNTNYCKVPASEKNPFLLTGLLQNLSLSFNKNTNNSWGGKSLHFYDGTGYYENMRINLKKRIQAFLSGPYAAN